MLHCLCIHIFQVTGLMIAICFLFISRSKPLRELAPKHPNRHFFTPYICISVLGQFIVHLSVLIAAHQLGRALDPRYEIIL